LIVVSSTTWRVVLRIVEPIDAEAILSSLLDACDLER
jgi:hypothetical protein